MPDIKDYTGKITSEHADKPKYMAMVEAVSQCFLDTNEVASGLPDDFDLDLANDAQLDDVGLWVGISRNIPTPLTNVYFALDTAGLGFDQGAWKGPFDPDNGITILDNETYRSLIRAKIGANHWDGTLESSKAILDLIFNPDGHAPFFPVTATNEPFGTGDGVTSTFQLKYQGQNVYEYTSATIYRTDWQGKQLLYPSARTNILNRSQEFDNSAWPKTRSSVTPNVVAAPDGTMTADKLVEDNTLGTHVIIRQASVTIGQPYVWSVFLKAGERKFASIQNGNFANQVASNAVFIDLVTGAWTSSDPGRTTVDALDDGWFRVSTMSVSANGGNFAPTILMNDAFGSSSYLGDGVSGLYIWQGDFVNMEKPSSSIPTVAAAVTVTDYAPGPFGQFTLGEIPLSGATLSWTGQGTAYAKGNYAYLVDNQDMTISIGLAGDPPSAIQWALLTGGYITPKPQSVDIKYFYSPTTSGPLFGFDVSNQYIAGFDQGSWGNVYS
jgi:hypothetical protein